MAYLNEKREEEGIEFKLNAFMNTVSHSRAILFVNTCNSIFSKLNNARDKNYFTNNCTNYWCDEWLLVYKKVILMVGLNENQ